MAGGAVTDAILAIDLGTSSIKLLVAGRDGAVLARGRFSHATSRPAGNAAEQDPAEWWQNLIDGAAELPSDVRIAAIGVTGQMHGLVLHDRAGAVIRPAITWEDRRSGDSLPALLERLPEDAPPVAPGFQAASWHWLKQQDPGAAGEAAHLLLPKDELVYRLTGRRVTDPSDAIGTGWYRPGTGAWDVAAIAASGARLDTLPPIVPAGSVAGPLTGTAAAALGLEAGIPVVIAGGDAAVAAFGAGATDPARPLVMMSTGCQALQPTETMPNRDAWPSANPRGLPGWLQVATTLNGGNVIGWSGETFGAPAPCVDPELVFLPYLAGERSDAIAGDASGAFVGLRAHHGRAEMARAAIDGVSLALADAFERAGGAIGDDAAVLAGGGGTHNEAWLGSLANALDRPVAAIAEPDLSAWGAARSAATALAWIDPVTDPDAWRPERSIVDPQCAPETARNRLERFRTLASLLFPRERR